MNKHIRLVATDMDGTLLDSRKQPPKDYAPWVIAHPHIVTVLASGRQYANLYSQVPEVSDKLCYIAENGAFVFQNTTMLFADSMSKEGLHALLDTVDGIPGAFPILCSARKAYMRHGSEEVERNGKMYYLELDFTEDLHSVIDAVDIGKMAVYVEEKKAETVFRALPPLYKDFRPVLSGADWFDVANKTVSKGAAMRFLQSHFGISPDDCMAFGDYLNDCDLLGAVTESYAMGNAHPELAKLAKNRTDTNDNDGVMQILRQIP